LIVNSTVVLFFSGNEAISLKVNSGTDCVGMKEEVGLGVGILGGGVNFSRFAQVEELL
jgi:hypothetical protein